MHRDFRRELSFARKLAAFEIRNHEVLRLKHAFIHASGSGQNAVIVQAYGDIAFAGDDEATIVHPLPSDTNFAAMLVFTLFMGGPERVGGHFRRFFLARSAIRTISLPPVKKTNSLRATGNQGRTLSH